MEVIPKATRQKGRLVFLALPTALRTQQLVGCRATLPAATTLRWGKAPAPVQQQVQVTSILAQEWRALLAKATPVTSKASLARPLPAESRFSLTRPISSGRLLLQNALRRISSRWTKRAKSCWRLDRLPFVTKRRLIRQAHHSLD